MSTHIPPARSWERDPADIRRSLIREMNRLGAYSLQGHYSGGHDEGGLDSLTVYDKDGKEIELKPEEGKYNWDLPLYQAVEDLLSTKFYTWALECSVYGDVYVDLKTKRAWTEGYEEVMSEQEDSDPLDWSW